MSGREPGHLGMASARNPLDQLVVVAGRHVDARRFLGQFVTLPTGPGNPLAAGDPLCGATGAAPGS